MLKLALFNVILIGLCVAGAVLCKKFARTDKAKRTILMIVSLSIVACHYSSLLFHLIADGTVWDHLSGNPNLLLPIYPCNVVMWCCVILCFVDFRSRLFAFLTDYIFLFGLPSALVGMFANVDFVRNPSLLNYDVTTGIIAHAIMLFNVILLPVFGFYKINFTKNLIHILWSIVGMFLIGCYCNIVCRVIGSESYAYQVNSMFLLHSPFENIPFLKYPLIAGVAAVAYAIILFSGEKLFCKNKTKTFSDSKKSRRKVS